MKIYEVIERIKKYHRGFGQIDETATRDRILYGNADRECTGIVTTCWANADVIRKAHDAGANLIICHEALFWNHGDNMEWLENAQNRTFLRKSKLLDEAGIVVWRDHDYIHSGIPVDGMYVDGILYGLAKKLGWETNIVDRAAEFGTMMFHFPGISVKKAAETFVSSLGLNGIRIIGDPNMVVKKIWICGHILGKDNGLISKMDEEDIDLAIALEMVDFTAAEYMYDSMLLGLNKAVMTAGHFNTEEPGMEYMLSYLPEIVEGIPCLFIPSGDMYLYQTGK